MLKSGNFCQGYTQTVYFDWLISPHTAVCRRTRYVSLRRYSAATQYTDNMAALAVVDKMTSLSPHV